ncbi:MAG: TonB-dependent receptor [bacterium]
MKRKLLLPFLLVFEIGLFAQQSGLSINGKVIDEISKEPLPGVNIIIPGTTIGAASDLNGEFTITGISSGTYLLQASFVGYESVVKTDVVVNSARPPYVIIELGESALELENVIVTSKYFEHSPLEVTSMKTFNYEEIRRSPGGFEDVIRALSVLPGVAQQAAARNDLIVRGGAPSENLYMLDGFMIPTINHFATQGATGGPLSYINLDFVRETSFSTGGFSSRYGDKLSSVLNIDLREGRDDRFGGKATISATQFGLNLEGPFNSKGNYLFSLRRSYLDFIFNAAGFSFVPEYYDLLSKMNYDFDPHNKLSFLLIGALDRVNFNNDDAKDIYDNSRILASEQNQYTAGLSFLHLFNKGFINFSASRSYIKYNSFQKDTFFIPIFLNKTIEAENEIKAEVVYKMLPNSEISAGLSGKIIDFYGDVIFPSDFITTYGEVLPVTKISPDEKYLKSALYTQYSGFYYDMWRVNLGFRVDYFDGIKNKYYFSPRFSTSLQFDELTSLNFSTGLYYQFPTYIWLLTSNNANNLNAIRVVQYVLGFERLLREDIRFKTEIFYKNYSDYPASILRSYLVLANTGVGFPGAEDNFAAFGLEPLSSDGKGFVRGLELSIQKKSSGTGLYGLMSGTYSESYFTSLDGIERPGAYDQKWIFSFSGGYIFDDEWETSFKFRFASGIPYTPFGLNGTQNISDYNTLRFDPLHSLDLRVDKRWNFESWSLITYIDVQNIYNNKQSNRIRWNYRENKLDEEESIGLLPSIGISVEF